jgi:hypothetical protein
MLPSSLLQMGMSAWVGLTVGLQQALDDIVCHVVRTRLAAGQTGSVGGPDTSLLYFCAWQHI